MDDSTCPFHADCKDKVDDIEKDVNGIKLEAAACQAETKTHLENIFKELQRGHDNFKAIGKSLTDIEKNVAAIAAKQ